VAPPELDDDGATWKRRQYCFTWPSWNSICAHWLGFRRIRDPCEHRSSPDSHVTQLC
jgi:hypothetical protein